MFLFFAISPLLLPRLFSDFILLCPMSSSPWSLTSSQTQATTTSWGLPLKNVCKLWWKRKSRCSHEEDFVWTNLVWEQEDMRIIFSWSVLFFIMNHIQALILPQIISCGKLRTWWTLSFFLFLSVLRRKEFIFMVISTLFLVTKMILMLNKKKINWCDKNE